MIVEVLEPSVLYGAKDGMYGEDGSETFDEYIAKLKFIQRQAVNSVEFFDLLNLKKNIEYLIGMER